MNKETILKQITTRLKGHNFSGEILDDCWSDHITERAGPYLTEEELLALDQNTDADDALGSGLNIVLREFIIYLCGLYSIGPEDLETQTTEATTHPVRRRDFADTANMVKLTKNYGNNETTILYAANCCSESVIRNLGDHFFNQPHGKRESFTYHRAGVIASGTDIHGIRRRSVFLLVWIEADEVWSMWYIDSCSNIAQGKKMINDILKSGEIRPVGHH